MNFKKVIFISILLLFLSVAAVSASDLDNNCTTESSAPGDSLVIGDSILGTSEIQNSDVSNNHAGTFGDLQKEINNASKGSILTLNRDYYGAFGNRVQLNKDLTIDGQGHTIDCLNAKGCSAFYSNSGNIVLKNIKLINGHNDNVNNGGAVYISGSAQYTIENCIFDNNWANKYGGAIYNGVNKQLTIINCTFNSNKAADYSGGAIYSKGFINMVDSVLTGNTAKVDGGAIYGENDANVKHSVFKSNRAEGAKIMSCYGGGIRVENNLRIINSTFKDNYAENSGGAVYAGSIIVNTDNSTFSSFFINNKAGKDKGGAFYSSGSITIIDSVLTGNTAKVKGGAMYAEDDANVKHCLFESNRAEGAKIMSCYGGAIYIEKHLTIYNSTFNNNYAENMGGALYASILTLNPNCYFNGNTARDSGGAIYASEFDKDINYVTFIGNTAKNYNGGAIYLDAKNIVTFSQCAFINNTCGCDGGAIYLDDVDSSLNLKRNFFIKNKASEGQCAYNVGHYGEISNNWWSKNPQTYNDELIEWKPLFIPNEHHTDSNPLKMQLTFSSSKNGIQNAALHFIKSNGQIISGELYDLNLIKFYSPDGNVSFTNKTVYPYGASTDFTINTPADSVTISAEIYGITISKTWVKSTISLGLHDTTVTVDNKTIKSVNSVLPAVKGNDFVEVFRNAAQYPATFLDSQGNYLKEGSIVQSNINDVIYGQKVTSNGLAKLNINLIPGQYIITSSYNRCNISNKITISS